jgi:hypothetical protein
MTAVGSRTIRDLVHVFQPAKYPVEMNIVLQYEFGKLNVKDDRFEVVVWFKGYPERLVVAFNAIKAFYDRTELKCSGS